MLAVDGHDLAVAAGARLRDDGAAGDEALLVGEREALAVLERGHGRGEPGEADHRVEHDVGVGVRGELGEHAGVVTAHARQLGRDAELARLRVRASSRLRPAASATTS